MKYNELVKWADDHGYTVKRNDGLISWHKNNSFGICGESTEMSKVATDIYNDITEGVWIEYQREEAARRAAKEIRIDPT